MAKKKRMYPFPETNNAGDEIVETLDRIEYKLDAMIHFVKTSPQWNVKDHEERITVLER